MMAWPDVEKAVKAWAIGNPRIKATVFDGTRTNVYLAMPAASPLPSLIVQRVGGGPVGTGTIPQDMSRISFDCWGTSRDSAALVAGTLVEELDNLGPTGGAQIGDLILEVAEIALWTWAPDIRIDYPRYIVDARIWSVRTA